jgi:hypothetical protein
MAKLCSPLLIFNKEGKLVSTDLTELPLAKRCELLTAYITYSKAKIKSSKVVSIYADKEFKKLILLIPKHLALKEVLGGWDIDSYTLIGEFLSGDLTMYSEFVYDLNSDCHNLLYES